MKLQNKYLYAFGTWLNTLLLSGKESRMRTKLVRELQELVKTMDQERKDIAESYSERNGEGEFVIVKDDKEQDSYKIKDDSIDECAAELAALGDKEVTVPLADKEMSDAIKNIILNTDAKIGPDFSQIYEIVCESLEGVV